MFTYCRSCIRVLGSTNVILTGSASRSPIFLISRWRNSVPLKSLSTLQEHQKNEYICGYEDIEELHNASENVKRIFRLENANQHEKSKVVQKDIDDRYGCASERTIADLTLKIDSLQKHCTDMPKDKHNKVYLQWLTDQRSKKMRYLKKNDFDKYLHIVKELNIPEVESTHSKWNKYKFRKFKIGVEVKEKTSFLDRKVVT